MMPPVTGGGVKPPGSVRAILRGMVSVSRIGHSVADGGEDGRTGARLSRHHRRGGLPRAGVAGDALIYVVLPLYPSAFGVEIATVAILLSVNRVIRIVGYGWVAPLARRFGANTLTAAACAAGALSTLGYGLLERLRRCCSSRG